MTTNVRPAANPANKQRNQMMIIGIVAAIAVVGVLAVIFVSNNAASATNQFDDIPMQRLPDGGFVMGNPEANVTIVEFLDYACPHCQTYKPTVDRFINEYVRTGKARFEHRVFPTAGGQMTFFNGNIAACLENQQEGAYWRANELFFQKAMRGLYNEDTARAVTQELELDYGQALECSRTETRVQNDIDLGRSVGVNGTPAVMVRYGDGEPEFINYNGVISETYEALVSAVNAAS